MACDMIDHVRVARLLRHLSEDVSVLESEAEAEAEAEAETEAAARAAWLTLCELP